jgi:hypothetical protein
MKFKIKIDKRISDERFMEHCLNLHCSGYNPMLLIAFYSLGRGWHYTKLLHLKKLLDEESWGRNK